MKKRKQDVETKVYYGIVTACEILRIEEPEVVFSEPNMFATPEMTSVYNPDLNRMYINKAWVQRANDYEIYLTMSHEMRHVYQTIQIKGLVSNITTVSKERVLRWKHEFENYALPTGNISQDLAYLEQDSEIDAIAFAAYLLRREYRVHAMIPQAIIKQVSLRIEEFDDLYT